MNTIKLFSIIVFIILIYSCMKPSLYCYNIEVKKETGIKIIPVYTKRFISSIKLKRGRLELYMYVIREWKIVTIDSNVISYRIKNVKEYRK